MSRARVLVGSNEARLGSGLGLRLRGGSQKWGVIYSNPTLELTLVYFTCMDGVTRILCNCILSSVYRRTKC